MPFCFSPILIISCLHRKDTRLSQRYIFAFRESLGTRLFGDTLSVVLASFPGYPAPECKCCNDEGRGEPGIFSHVSNKGGRKEHVGILGEPEQRKEQGYQPACFVYFATTPSVEECENIENSGPLPIMSYSCEKRHQALSKFAKCQAIATRQSLQNILGKRAFVISRSTFPSAGAHTGHWTGSQP